MNKYYLLIPIIGVVIPSYLKDWDNVVKDNPFLFTVSFIIQIVSMGLMFIICS